MHIFKVVRRVEIARKRIANRGRCARRAERSLCAGTHIFLAHSLTVSSRCEKALDFIEIENVARQQKAETVYRELLTRRIINAVKVGTEEYKEKRKPWEFFSGTEKPPNALIRLAA